MNRREFLQGLGFTAGAFGILPLAGCKSTPRAYQTALGAPRFHISLAEWSFHRTLFEQKSMTHLDFPIVARRDFGIDAVEYVNQFFMDKAKDQAYLNELKRRCNGEGVRSVLIMCDGEGNLGDVDDARRQLAVQNHHKWADAAKFLGCHSIRVNAATGGIGSFEEQQNRAAEGLRRLSEYGSGLDLGVIVENHGGLSSNGKWLAGVMRLVGMPNCGTLPDFGNFDDYDRYEGVSEMMPYAKGVSAKSHDFDAQGNETHTDYRRMLKIVLDAGYRSYIGIEYEGSKLSERDGILRTKQLLQRILAELG